MVHDGKLCATVWMVTHRNGGGFYCPTDLDSKTGEPVIDVLRHKHPEARITEADHFYEYQDEPNDVGIFYF